MKTTFRYLLFSLLILLSIDTMAQVNRWQDIYTARKKDTVFGIAQKYGLSVVDLMEANPEMKQVGYALKKGDTVFIPFKKQTSNVASTSQNTQKKTSTNIEQPYNNKELATNKCTIRIGVMLPLHDVDGDGRRMVEYYRGLLLACEDLKRQGISTDISAWNVDINTDIHQTLIDDKAKRCNIIFGPLYSKQVKPLGDFCKQYGIKLVIPFSIEGNEVAVNPQIYQIYQPADCLSNDAIRTFLEHFSHYHPVFIDCNDATSKKGDFTLALRKQLDARHIAYNITNLKSTTDQFTKAFSLSQPNILILNTARSPELNATLAKINILKAVNPMVSIAMFGYTEWLMYTKVYNDYFYKYETYIPTVAFYNAQSLPIQQVEQRYKQWFKEDMLYALPRFALTGYDHAQFFCRGLHHFGKNFFGSKTENDYTALQTPLHFKRIDKGGMQNQNFMLIHYKSNHSIECISY